MQVVRYKQKPWLKHCTIKLRRQFLKIEIFVVDRNVNGHVTLWICLCAVRDSDLMRPLNLFC
jgi:hypothetical protein